MNLNKKRKHIYKKLRFDKTIVKHGWESLATKKPEGVIVVDASVTKKKSTDSIGTGQIKGVNTNTGEIIFNLQIPGDTTINIAEYLAIHCGLEWCLKQGRKPIIYSDSIIAIAWVNNRQCKTKYHTPDNRQRLAILRAERRINEINPKVLWWNTKSWGENPADFGRK